MCHCQDCYYKDIEISKLQQDKNELQDKVRRLESKLENIRMETY